MNALLFIKRKREALERIEFISTLRVAMNGDKRDVEQYMHRLAREADVNLRFED